MKASVSIASRRPSEARHVAKRLSRLLGSHSVPIRELLSEPFLRQVGCTSSPLFHDRLKTIDEEDKAALDDLATHFTLMSTFGELIGHATGDWALAKLKQKGIGGTAKVTTKATLSSPPANLSAKNEPLNDAAKDQSPAEAKPDTLAGSNTSEDTSPKTPLSNDDLIFERLRKLDPLAFQFAQEKKIRLVPRPNWSWAFEWMRTTFDVEERTDSSGTYFAFLYSPSLSDYQKLTYLISTIRADKGFKEWLDARQIVERRPTTISPAPGTPEYADYEAKLKEQSFALMADLGATPKEIAARRRGDIANEWLGPGGLFWEIPNILSVHARGDFRSLIAPVTAAKPRYETWNKYQAGNKGRFKNSTEAAKGWQRYKDQNAIVTGTPRNATTRKKYLKSLTDHYGTPRWMKPLLKEGKTPEGYEVDHIVPLSVNGADVIENMRLQSTELHRMHHKRHAPWKKWEE